jgi:hypothetical protein
VTIRPDGRDGAHADVVLGRSNDVVSLLPALRHQHVCHDEAHVCQVEPLFDTGDVTNEEIE